MKINSLYRLRAALQQKELEAAPRKYKKKRMSELSDSSLAKISRDTSDPRHAMALRELKHRRATNRKQQKQDAVKKII